MRSWFNVPRCPEQVTKLERAAERAPGKPFLELRAGVRALTRVADSPLTKRVAIIATPMPFPRATISARTVIRLHQPPRCAVCLRGVGTSVPIKPSTRESW
jgi:hypothetical protein